MAIKIMDAGGVLRTISNAKIKDGSALRTLRSVKLMDGATLRTVSSFVQPLTLDVSPASLSSYPYLAGATSSPATATPTGGLAPFTYSWVRTVGSTKITADSAANATTTFSAIDLVEGAITVATFRCTCTDALGTTATDTIEVEFDRIAIGSI